MRPTPASKPPPILPLPEAVKRKRYSIVEGRGHCDQVAGVLAVPLDGSPTSRRIAAHEVAHAAWSPPRPKAPRSVPDRAIQRAEDLRMNLLSMRAGLGEVLQARIADCEADVERFYAAFAGNRLSAYTSALATVNTGDFEPMLGMFAKLNPLMAVEAAEVGLAAWESMDEIEEPSYEDTVKLAAAVTELARKRDAEDRERESDDEPPPPLDDDYEYEPPEAEESAGDPEPGEDAAADDEAESSGGPGGDEDEDEGEDPAGGAEADSEDEDSDEDEDAEGGSDDSEKAEDAETDTDEKGSDEEGDAGKGAAADGESEAKGDADDIDSGGADDEDDESASGGSVARDKSRGAPVALDLSDFDFEDEAEEPLDLDDGFMKSEAVIAREDIDEVEAAVRQMLDENGRYARGMHAESAKMTVVTPPRPKRLPARLRGRRQVARTEGTSPRWVNRYCSDGAIFGGPMKRPGGGTLVIDVSGSMSLAPGDIQRVMEELPASTIAMYCAGREGGELTILAKDGRRVEDAAIDNRIGHMNAVDVPALEWLAKQAQPRLWVCDGDVTGANDTPGANIFARCAELCRRYRILRLPTMADAMNWIEHTKAVAKGGGRR